MNIVLLLSVAVLNCNYSVAVLYCNYFVAVLNCNYSVAVLNCNYSVIDLLLCSSLKLFQWVLLQFSLDLGR